MRTLIVSSSMSPDSRSNRLARMAADWLLENRSDVTLLKLPENEIPGFGNDDLFESATYLEYCQQLSDADSLILASPVYNWSFCSNLKKYLELVGSTDATRITPLFDKLVSFIFAAGLPHSHMVLGSLAMPLMLDFRCIINPHQAYIYNRHWDAQNTITGEGTQKLEQMLDAHMDLSRRLQGYHRTSLWTV